MYFCTKPIINPTLTESIWTYSRLAHKVTNTSSTRAAPDRRSSCFTTTALADRLTELEGEGAMYDLRSNRAGSMSRCSGWWGSHLEGRLRGKYWRHLAHKSEKKHKETNWISICKRENNESLNHSCLTSFTWKFVIQLKSHIIRSSLRHEHAR